VDDSNNKTTYQSATQRHPGQIILSLGVFALGVALAVGTSQFPESTGYAKVGPRLMPTIVAGGLIVLSLLLLKEAFFGGFKGVDEAEAAATTTATDWRAFLWITAGIILDGILIVPAGFVIAGTLLFVLSARGFESRAWIRNAIIGFVIAALTYAFFNYGLGLGLPKGILPF
jgi:putative tricarboxylic transport membrane protein